MIFRIKGPVCICNIEYVVSAIGGVVASVLGTGTTAGATVATGALAAGEVGVDVAAGATTTSLASIAAASAGTTAGTIGTVGSLAGVASGIGTTVSSLTNRPDIPKPPVQESEPLKPTEAAYAQAEIMRKRRGAASTVLTSPLGIQSTQGGGLHARLGD